MPFITEELGRIGRAGQDGRTRRLAHIQCAELVDAAADREMNWVISLIEGIRSARNVRVPAGLRIPMIVTGWMMQVRRMGAKEAMILNLPVWWI